MTEKKLPYEMTEAERKQMSRGEWKEEALRDILFIHKVQRQREAGEKVSRYDSDYAGYLKRFYFGDDEEAYGGKNKTWTARITNRDIPMPRNIYLFG